MSRIVEKWNQIIGKSPHLERLRVQIDNYEDDLSKELALSRRERDEIRRKVVESKRILADIRYQELQAESATDNRWLGDDAGVG